ncbi:hypothetical protein GJAV_G00133240 [Gymnothorax javanicus]|nr:hypothetical protein GJAV_G00133240 [Gymnothorax javanicus]
MAGIGDKGLRNITFIAENATGDESSLGQNESGYMKQIEDEEAEAPAVFQCSRCKLPVGDSLSWVGSDDDQNQILLKRVTDNVVVGKEPFLSRTLTEVGCLIVNLSCLGCSSPLGSVYTSTPENLDYKRSLYCLSVENVDCYVLGSSNQRMIENSQNEPVTLECRATINTEIEKIKALAVSMALRLFEIEGKLQMTETK